MNKKILLSAFIVLFVIAASLGATMAWFTDEAGPIDNVFEAGTIVIEADDRWDQFGTENWTNANPGECQKKIITVTNDGTKNMYVRFSFNGIWTEILSGAAHPHGMDNSGFTADNSLVTITPAEGFEDDWTELNNGSNTWWYYNGILPPSDGATDDHILTFEFLVCLDGPDTTNEYQGATYTVTFNFGAIQATHEASFAESGWGAGYVKYPLTTGDQLNEWEFVNYIGEQWEIDFTDPALSFKWIPTDSGVPNFNGWVIKE